LLSGVPSIAQRMPRLYHPNDNPQVVSKGTDVPHEDPKKILMVVDDDEAILASLDSVLTSEGYTVVTATNGRDALDYLKSVPPPDLAIVDLMMPIMDGWAFAAELRHDVRLAATPVVVISAAGERTLSRAPVASGYLSKPLQLEPLLDIIRRSLRSERSEDTMRIFRDMRPQKITSSRLSLPTVLAVEPTEAFVRRGAEIAACGGAVLKTATLEALAERAREVRPVALLMTDAVYRTGPDLIEAVAAEVDARVLRVAAEEMEPTPVESRIRRAVQESGRF
jgi:CheY-like chemotaxis protein